VQRQAYGTFTLTQYCKLVLQLSPALEFVYKHREYFLSRDISQLHYEFINLIGELSLGILETNVANTINHVERMIEQLYLFEITSKKLDPSDFGIVANIKNNIDCFSRHTSTVSENEQILFLS
jgi:hypothetical protein